MWRHDRSAEGSLVAPTATPRPATDIVAATSIDAGTANPRTRPVDRLRAVLLQRRLGPRSSAKEPCGSNCRAAPWWAWAMVPRPRSG